MKVALCCIGRLENQYAIEFVEYYKQLGIDKIFIYDNNYDEEEHFEDVLQEYMDENIVEIIDYRNKENHQLIAYNDCYKKHCDEYDWIAFFDFDEFLTLENDKDIKSFLTHFENFDVVKINWMIFTDNDIVMNDHRPLLERFYTPMEYDKQIMYSFPENNHVKSIVRGKIKNFIWKMNPHTPTLDKLKYCDSTGKESNDSPFQKYNYNVAYLKHFITKTIDEYYNTKVKRGYPDGNKDFFKNHKWEEIFFKYNEKTTDKIKFINGVTNNDLNVFICTHKDFNKPVASIVYQVINNNYFKLNTLLDDKFYSELYNFKYVCDNFLLKKYIGFCHYRRYFSFLYNIPNIDKVFDNFDCIVATPLQLDTSVREHYSIFHNIEDLEIVENIIKEKYPDYYEMCELFLNCNLFVPYNMFIIKTEYFKKYIEFIFGILDEYLKIVGADITGRIEKHKDKYLKNFYPNNTIEYQYRIGGYIAERLTNIFLMKHFKKMKMYDVIITEDKYKLN